MNAQTAEKVEIIDEVRWHSLQKKHHEAKVSHVFRMYRECGIEPLLIKGLASCLNYPPDVPRSLWDIDIAVSAADFSRATDLARSDEFQGYLIDVHRELRQLDSLSWNQLIENSRFIDVDGAAIRVLAPEDHLRVISVHWLTDGGAYKDKLWDIYYAIQNRPQDFDWSRCLDVVDPTRRNWILAAISIAHQYLDLKIDALPIKSEVTELSKWIKNCIEKEWRSGIRVTAIPSPTDDLSGFFNQIRKRIPPNPVASTIECQGKFGRSLPVRYQLRVLLRFGGRAVRSAKHSLFSPVTK